MKKSILIILLFMPMALLAQHLQKHQIDGSNTGSGLGTGETFNPFKKNEKDSTKSATLKVPQEIHQWKIDRRFGNVNPIIADTMQYMFQNSQQTEGITGDYNFLGSMGTPRLTRIFFNRETSTSFDFLQPYDYFYTTPDRFIFTDTKSPYTNLTYHSSGNKVDGDDRFRAYFTTNAGKKFGAGFLFDYLYARGRYDNQASALMNFSLFSFYRSERYNYHLLASRYHMKQAENGGITDDRYITRPEETDGSNSNFGTQDIPVYLEAAWNRNEVYNIFFTHNYNMGFYRDVLQGDSSENIDEEVKKEFVKVARITHTLDAKHNMREFINHNSMNGYYATTYMPFDSVDNTKWFSINNKVALSLCEGFSKWAFADITAFASYTYNYYTLPDTLSDNTIESRKKYNEHILSIGGIAAGKVGNNIRYEIEGETAISGDEIGTFSLDGKAEMDFKLFKKDIRLTAHAFAKNNRPSFYYRHYHSEHIWWDNKLDKEFKTRIEGKLEIPSWKTTLHVGVENIKNYTYIANNAVAKNGGTGFAKSYSVKQAYGDIQVLTAALKQDFKFGILNINTELTYQNSSNKEVLPLPELNAYANVFIKFKIAQVLNTELGADARYFTSYYAPDYSPELGQFVQQNQADRVEIGNYPLTSVYANFLLKQTRFYVKYYHLNEGSGNRNYFLAPHYPMTPAVLWFGLSWNFYN